MTHFKPTPSVAQRIRERNAQKMASFFNLSYSLCRIKSKNPLIDGASGITMILHTMQVVEKDEFTTPDGKKIPAQKYIRLSGLTYLSNDGEEGTRVVCDMPLQDRFRTCNIFLNKLAFALDKKEDWDGTIRLAVYRKDDSGRLYCNFFENCDNAEHYAGIETNFFEFDVENKRFSGVPEVKPLLNKRGEPVVKDGKNVYDTDDFDAFYLTLAIDLCNLVGEFWEQQ